MPNMSIRCIRSSHYVDLDKESALRRAAILPRSLRPCPLRDDEGDEAILLP
jgi:hypothetical protein